MPARKILHYDIADRQMALRHSVAPDDFVLLRRDTPHDFPRQALAYCADLQSERVLYTLHPQPLQRLFEAPFLYAAQLTDAAGVVSIPFEYLEYPPASQDRLRPTLIFSPGRTGSTLLARLIAACGAPCASEPDMPAQIGRFHREDRMRIGFDAEVALQRAWISSLCDALGPAPFVKLRSHCNARPLPMVEAAPAASTVFMLRQRLPWARSRHLAFGEPPVSVAFVLRQAIDALDKLLGAGIPLRILWYEAVLRDPAAALAGIMPPGAVERSVLASVMSRDSQAGTALARARLASAAVDDGFDATFDIAWAQARADAAWGSTTLAYLNAMDRETEAVS